MVQLNPCSETRLTECVVWLHVGEFINPFPCWQVTPSNISQITFILALNENNTRPPHISRARCGRAQIFTSSISVSLTFAENLQSWWNPVGGAGFHVGLFVIHLWMTLTSPSDQERVNSRQRVEAVGGLTSRRQTECRRGGKKWGNHNRFISGMFSTS